MNKKILVVDDEESILTLLKFNLEKSGYVVSTANNGREAIDLCLNEIYDLIVLDIMLPKLDGIEVLKELRKNIVNIPVILLTARDDEIDKIIGLELGADDYITKPFSPRELIARVKAVLRRYAVVDSVQTNANDGNNKKYNIGDLEIYEDKFEVFLKSELLNLTPKEFELLVYFVKNKGKVFAREQLLNAVWNYDYLGDSRVVDVHVSHLRDKLESDSDIKYIRTVRGIGYKFEGK